MRYVGGKSRIAGELVPFVRAAMKRARSPKIIEPFCGGLGMTCALVEGIPLAQIEASDVAPGLITLYNAVKAGWEPPRYVPKEAWQKLKERAGEDDKFVAFAGFGCSFNGIYFTSYGFPEFARQAADGLARKLKTCSKVEFHHRSYQEIDVLGPCVIYCDPPYANTDQSAYRALKNTPHKDFDSEAFWSWARRQASKGAHVLVSEYSGPDDAKVVWQKSIASLAGNHDGEGDHAVERLFYLEGA